MPVTSVLPDTPFSPGADRLPPNTDPEQVDEWQVDKTGKYPTYRCVWSNPLYSDPSIRVVGVQLTDGSISLAEGDAPSVYIDDDLMAPEAARALAAALNDAADLAESWAMGGGVR